MAPDMVLLVRFSIHALHEEGDRWFYCIILLNKAFLSTPSTRRATLVHCISPFTQSFSIHALHEEGDPLKFRLFGKLTIFLSTPSTRRATAYKDGHCLRLEFSIHALHEEGDPCCCESRAT